MTMHTISRARETVDSPWFVVACAVAAGSLGLVVGVFVTNPYTQVLPVAVGGGGLVGWALRRRTSAAHRYQFPFRYWPNRWLRVGLFVALYVCFAASLVLYVRAGYQRPPSVQLLQVAMYAVVALLALVLKSTPKALSILFATAVFHRAQIYYASAVQLGNDALFHNQVAAAIAQTGTLAPLETSKYWYAPVYHLLVAFVSAATSLTTRDAAFLVVTVVGAVVPALVVFAFLRRTWSDLTGTLGALLFVAADSVLLVTVHTMPTTLGVVFFALLFWSADAFLREPTRLSFAGFVGALLGLIYTHQLSLFVTVVAVVTYITALAFRRGRLLRRDVGLSVLLVGGFLYQSMTTKYGGPAGDTGSFFQTVAPSFVGSLQRIAAGTSRGASYPPRVEDLVVSGADALTIEQVVGLGILFGLAVIGAIVWSSRSTDDARRSAVPLGAATMVMSLVVFVPPAFGVAVFIPGRWFPFLYLFLAVLAAPGVVVLASAAGERFGRGLDPSAARRRVAVAAITLLLITVPYATFMTMNGMGAPDNPVFDRAPGAARLTTTQQEDAAYRFVDDYAVGVTVVADHGAWRTIERHYEHPAVIYTKRYGESGTAYDGDLLFVYRDYARTRHGSYQLLYEGEKLRVRGPLPPPSSRASVVYSSGTVTLYYENGEDGGSDGAAGTVRQSATSATTAGATDDSGATDGSRETDDSPAPPRSVRPPATWAHAVS